MTIMATSAYLSAQGPPSAGTVTSEHEDNGVMNLVNTPNSQGYSLPREQVVRVRLWIVFKSPFYHHCQKCHWSRFFREFEDS